MMNVVEFFPDQSVLQQYDDMPLITAEGYHVFGPLETMCGVMLCSHVFTIFSLFCCVEFRNILILYYTTE